MSIAREPGTLFALGVNYKTAPVEIREKLHLDDFEITTFLEMVRQNVGECYVISTCNRTEIYGVSAAAAESVAFLKRTLIELKGAQNYIQDEHFFALIACAASQQIFSVATSIDSRVIGDSQILSQLRKAYSIAGELGLAGKILNQLLQRALKLGKTTYTQTAIHDGAASVSVAAVELAKRRFGSLRQRTAMVVGTGETGKIAAEALIKKHIGKLLVTNRTRARAEALLDSLKQEHEFDGEVVDFENFKLRLPEVDLLISSTGSQDPILFKADLARQPRPTMVIDVAVPRDVDSAVVSNENVTLNNIDDINALIDETQLRRLHDLPKVRSLIAKEMVDFLTWYYLLPLIPDYEKTGCRVSADQRKEMIAVKKILHDHLPEIHRIAAEAGNDFYRDLESHSSLITKLRAMRPTVADHAA